jgi:hypothetical protein
MKNLTKAVIKVMKEVRGMEKNSKVGTGNHSYNGTKDQDVKDVFNQSMSKNGLIMFPREIEDDVDVERWEEETNYGKKHKQSIFTKVKVYYTLAHESGEEVTICGYGHGVDTQDKSAGKATTYAMKNALLYTFMTPVGKIDDADTMHSKEIETPKTKGKGKSSLKTKTSSGKKKVVAGTKEFNAMVEWINSKKGTVDKALENWDIDKQTESILRETIKINS